MILVFRQYFYASAEREDLLQAFSRRDLLLSRIYLGQIWQKVPYGYIDQNHTSGASAKYYHLRAYSENFKQLSSRLTNIWRFDKRL